jgi:hypothetical protein
MNPVADLLRTLVIGCGALATGACVVQAGQETEMKTLTTYPVAFADHGRTGRMTVTVRLRGTRGWSSPLSKTPPTALLMWEGRLVVVTSGTMMVFGPDGKPLWEQPHCGGSALAAAGKPIYFQSRSHRLGEIGPDGQATLREHYLPGSGDDAFRLLLLIPDKRQYLNVIYWPGQDFGQKTDVSWRVARYGERLSVRGGVHKSIPLMQPLYLRELRQLVMAFHPGELVVVDTESGRDLVEPENPFANDPRKPYPKLPVEKPVDWCADADGTVCILGYEADWPVIATMSLEGAIAWRMVLKRPGRWSGSPPVLGQKGLVYALLEGHVMVLEKGRLIWQYESKEAPRLFGTSMADGTLLLAAGKRMIHLDCSGKELASVDLGEEILAPPVADSEGAVYAVTARQLIQVR